MSMNITIRDIDPADRSWLRREARRTGVSMEELIRRLIHEERTKTECRPKPSEAFARYFGEQHGIERLPLAHCGYKPLSFPSKEETNYLLRSPGNAKRLRAAIAELDAGKGEEHTPIG